MGKASSVEERLIAKLRGFKIFNTYFPSGTMLNMLFLALVCTIIFDLTFQEFNLKISINLIINSG